MLSIDQEMKQGRRAVSQLSLSPEQRALLKRASSSPADFMNRLRTRDKRRIDNPDGTHSTHLMGWEYDPEDRSKAIVFPEIQPDEQGNLRNYGPDALDRAIERSDTLSTTPELADWFTRNYKTFFPVE
jgi:hypothetical protein